MSYSSEALKRFNYLLSETTTVYHDAAARLGLSYSVMQILYTVCSDGDGRRCPLSEVCRQTGISKQTVNSALRRLEGEGLVCLERAGGKHKDVCLTVQGAALAKRTVVRIMEAENAAFSGWTDQEVDSYLALAEKYLSALREAARGLNVR